MSRKPRCPSTPRVRLTNVEELGDIVRTELALAGIPTRRSSDQASDTGLHEVSAVAQQLLERRSALEEFVPPHERSTLASVLRRTPPSPAALVCIADLKVRTRYLKCLNTADIALEEVR